jgi:hypothetical protein
MSRSIAFSSVVSLLVAATVLGVAHAARAEENPFGPIRVAANRSQYDGRCPIDIVYTGNINLNYPHPNGLAFNYYWMRSDGAKSAVTVVRPRPTERMLIVRESWHLGAAGRHYDASVTLFVNSGNTHLEQTSSVVSVTCR